jgi:hypothetical protein
VKRLAVILAVLAAVPAAADEDAPEKTQARLLLSQGNALFERGDLRGALVDFRAAYALYPSPKLLVNAAAAERELGDLAGAANDLRHFLDDDSGDDPFLTDKARTDLRALERRLGRVTLPGWPVRTTIEVDGRPQRDPAYVRPGERHHVKVRAPGGVELDDEVQIGAGEVYELPLPARVSSGSSTTPRPAPRRPWWIAGVVVAVGVAAAGITIGVVYGSPPSSGSALTGEIGSFKFSQFH